MAEFCSTNSSKTIFCQSESRVKEGIPRLSKLNGHKKPNKRTLSDEREYKKRSLPK
jgi:hypothetical protein